MKVYFSPSSKTGNVGVDNYGTEGSRMQELSNLVVTKLGDKGITAYGSGNTLTLTQRINASNNAGVDSHIALHSNAGGGTGPEVWYYTNPSYGKRLVQNILSEIEGVSNCPKSRDIKSSVFLTF